MMTHLDNSQMALPFSAMKRRAMGKNGFAQALAIVVRAGRQAEIAQKAQACCPHCGHKGPVLTDFGLRKIRGRVQAQSWCRGCRKAKSSKTPQLPMRLGDFGRDAEQPADFGCT